MSDWMIPPTLRSHLHAATAHAIIHSILCPAPPYTAKQSQMPLSSLHRAVTASCVCVRIRTQAAVLALSEQDASVRLDDDHTAIAPPSCPAAVFSLSEQDVSVRLDDSYDTAIAPPRCHSTCNHSLNSLSCPPYTAKQSQMPPLSSLH